MSLVSLLIVLLIIGFVLWIVTKYVPLAPPFRQIILAVGALVALLVVLQAFGVIGSIGSLRIR